MTTRGPRRFSGQTISSHSGRDSIAEIIDTDDAGLAATEEINEIKRYEDFTTIDWVQDAVQEQRRRRARRRKGADFWDKEGTFGWRRKVREAYDAGQTWLVVTIVGSIIGLNAAFLNIVTEWLSDIKLGYCTTAFYLNEQFCCWGADGGLLLTWDSSIQCDLLMCNSRVSRVAALGFQCIRQLHRVLYFRRNFDPSLLLRSQH